MTAMRMKERRMRIMYMGTPDFAVLPLKAILDAGYEVSAVVTQPDRPKGRSGKLVPCPVKELATERGLTVLQPDRIRNPESVELLKKYPADIYVVAAFGQILTREILDIPRYGCINIHASLLPHLRGASPIQHAILGGDKMTGVTIMQMDEGIDTGDILLQESCEISDNDTGGTLFDKLAELGAEMIVKVLPMIEAGTVTPVPQDPDKADHVGMLKKSMGRMDFSLSAEELERRVRGLDPWPGAYTELDGKQLKIWKTHVIKGDYIAPPGTVTGTGEGLITVACGQDFLAIEELQPEGKRRMTATDYLNGRGALTGIILGKTD